jgi:hypothetical protein
MHYALKGNQLCELNHLTLSTVLTVEFYKNGGMMPHFITRPNQYALLAFWCWFIMMNCWHSQPSPFPISWRLIGKEIFLWWHCGTAQFANLAEINRSGQRTQKHQRSDCRSQAVARGQNKELLTWNDDNAWGKATDVPTSVDEFVFQYCYLCGQLCPYSEYMMKLVNCCGSKVRLGFTC